MNEETKEKIKELKSSVDSSIEEKISSKMEKKAIELENKLEFQQLKQSIGSEFNTLKDIDADLVNEFSEKYKDFNNNNFQHFKSEFDYMKNLDRKLSEKAKENNFVKPSFNSKSTDGVSRAQNSDELFKMKLNNEEIPYSKTEDGLYITQAYVDLNNEIREEMELFAEGYLNDTTKIEDSNNKLIAGAMRQQKYFTVL
jgi:hypothetical protein